MLKVPLPILVSVTQSRSSTYRIAGKNKVWLSYRREIRKENAKHAGWNQVRAILSITLSYLLRVARSYRSE